MLSMTRSHDASSPRWSVTVIRPRTSSPSLASSVSLATCRWRLAATVGDDGVGAGPRPRPGDDVVPRPGDDLDEPGAHHAGPDDADDVDLGHAASLVTHR